MTQSHIYGLFAASVLTAVSACYLACNTDSTYGSFKPKEVPAVSGQTASHTYTRAGHGERQEETIEEYLRLLEQESEVPSSPRDPTTYRDERAFIQTYARSMSRTQ